MNLTNNELYNSIVEKHKPLLDDIEEAVIIHKIRNIEIESMEKVKQVEDIIDYWCKHYDVTKEQVEGGSRLHKIKMVRYCVFWTVRKQIIRNSFTMQAIGALFNRHHSTVIHAMKQMEDWIQYDPIVRGDVMVMLNHFGYRAEWHFELEELSWINKKDLYLDLATK